MALTVKDGKFELDGTEHEESEDCLCHPSECFKCGLDTVHFQGVYGGYIQYCTNCKEFI